MQNEYIELGAEIFGPTAFGGDRTEGKGVEKGFKREMELLDLEHGARVEELAEEVVGISVKILQKMKASEKVCRFELAGGWPYLYKLSIGAGRCREAGAGQATSSTHSRLSFSVSKVGTGILYLPFNIPLILYSNSDCTFPRYTYKQLFIAIRSLREEFGVISTPDIKLYS